jgi:hypothetical protein
MFGPSIKARPSKQKKVILYDVVLRDMYLTECYVKTADEVEPKTVTCRSASTREAKLGPPSIQDAFRGCFPTSVNIQHQLDSRTRYPIARNKLQMHVPLYWNTGSMLDS